MKKLDKSERHTLIIWTIFGIIFLILVTLIQINIPENNIPILNIKKTKYVSVKDYSRYYTVKNALTKFYSYINTSNYQAVNNILDNKYNINEENINEILGVNDENIEIVTHIIYEKKIKKGIISYLVTATEMNNTTKIRDVYYEIILDGNNFLFKIKPLKLTEYAEAIDERY